MRRICWLVMSALLLTACGPSKYVVQVEMRSPSTSGIDLYGKSISVLYLENENTAGNHLLSGMADGFAYSLEQDYGLVDGSVNIYHMPHKSGAVYSEKDSLVNILLETGTDVIFLFDTLKTEKMTAGDMKRVVNPKTVDSTFITTCNMPFTVRVHCYDSMHKSDKVYSFGGNSIAAPHAYSNGYQSVNTILERAVRTLPDVGFEVGKMLSSSFLSVWRQEQYTLTYFDSQQWYKALESAERGAWKEAMNTWLELAEARDVLKRSCAAYNISVACYMLGNYELASLWLDRSDRENKLPMSDAMRKRIGAKYKK